MLTQITNALAHQTPWLFAIVWKTTALLLAAWAASRALRNHSASLRHFLHSVAVCAVLTLPVASLLLPTLQLAVLPPASNSAQQHFATSQPSVSQVFARNDYEPVATGPRAKAALATGHVQAAPTIAASSGTARSAEAFTQETRQSQINLQGMAVLLWICGSAVCLIRMCILKFRLHLLVRRATPVESIPLTSRLRWLCRDYGIRREVIILASQELDVPIATGVVDPKIVLSPQAGSWSEPRRNAVLCHELAHIKRLDAITQFVGEIAAAIYWFHPLVWLTIRSMRLERERACDDYVLAHGTPASDYAHELLEIVSSLRRPQPVAALAMARRSQLEGRVLALLNPGIRHSMLAPGPALALVVGIMAFTLPLAAAILQERTADSTNAAASASSVPKVAPALAGDVIREDTRGEVAGAIENGIEGGIEGGVPSGLEGGVRDGVRAGVGVGKGTGSFDIGLPEYPGAIAMEHEDGRGTVSLIDGARVRQLQAGAYLSQDQPQRVLQFYRERLKSFGQVVECAGGTNTRIDVQLNDESLRNPSSCRPDEFGKGGTEIKLATGSDRWIVVAMPHDAGSEIALVRYEPSSFSSENAWSQVNTSSAPFDCFEGSSSNHTNISSHSDGDANRTWTASWSGGECTVEAHSSGTVRFNAEATAIESITPGGYFEVDERKGDALRRVRVEPGSNGQLNYTYKLNGSPHEFDADARAWFSKFLLEMERAAGFSANTRVPALLAKGGPQAVLTEITQLDADYVRQIYFIKLFENATLPSPMLVKALDQARDEISTDYSLAQVLLAIAKRYDLDDEAQRVAFLNGANKLHTDYEHARVLIELLKRPNLSPQIVRAALESAKSIGTDYEKGRILTTLASLSRFDESEINTYLDLASSIGTDYEHSRSLMALMERQKLSPAAVSQILKSASSIGTDYEKSRILIAVNGSNQFDEKQIATYLSLVDSIGTDYERSRDLMALMADHKLNDESVARIISETQKIGTDYEKARVLTAAAQRYQLQGTVRDAYIKAANSIGTEYERNRTLAAIAKREMM